MEIVLKDITEIKNYDKNARTHSDEQIDQIVNSISNFGFNDPIEIDANHRISVYFCDYIRPCPISLNSL